MAIGFDASSESHTGTTGSASQASFSWTHTPVSANPMGVLVYTFTNANADNATAVTYAGRSLTAVSGGRAVDTAGEAGDCKAWFLAQGRTYAAPSGTWQGATSGTANIITKFAYGNGYWVAVGASGTIRWATDPTGTWTAASSPGFSTNSVSSVAYGNGYWVAVGDTGTIRYATDPTGTWTAASSPGFSTNDVNDVAYGNGYWVAVGASGTIRYTTDPTGTWSAPSSPGFDSTFNLNYVTYGDGYWVATAAGASGSTSNLMRYATDPTGTWSLPSTTFWTYSLYQVSYGNGAWVVVDDFGRIRYTTDPTKTWSLATSGVSTRLYEAKYADGLWIAVGLSGVMRYATDPAGTWAAVTSPGFSNSGIFTVAYADGLWLAGGASGGMRYAGNYTTIPAVASTVAVTRTNNANVMYATAITVTGGYPAETTGVVLEQEDQTLTEENVTDSSPGTNSMRFAAVNSGLREVDLTTSTSAANTLVAGANSTGLQSIRLASSGNEFTAEKNYAISTTALSTSASGTSITSGDTTSATFAVARTMTRGSLSADVYPSGAQNWDITYVLTGILAQYESRMKIQRLNSSGTMQTESGYGTTRSANGTFTDTLSWTPGTWSANDQLALVWEHRRTASTELNYLTSTTALSTTASGTSIASGSTQSATFVVALTMVRSSLAAGYFASGSQTWTLDYTVTAMTTPDYEMRLKIQRRNSSGTMQAETAYGTTRSTNGAFTDTFTADLGTWAANDQLAVVWEHRRISGTGNKSASITAGGTSYVTTPIPARNSSITANGSSYVNSPTVAASRVIGVVRETTAGQGSRPVGFQGTTSDDVAAVYLAVREATPSAIIAGVPTK